MARMWQKIIPQKRPTPPSPPSSITSPAEAALRSGYRAVVLLLLPVVNQEGEERHHTISIME